MTSSDIIEALSLPAECLVGSRIAKQLLSEKGANTAAARRVVRETVDELRWVASLKPSTIGVPAFSDDTRDYPEVIILALRTHTGATADRLPTIIHRAIPYPTFLVADADGSVTLSMARKRKSVSDSAKAVLEEAPLLVTIDSTQDAASSTAFLASLAVAQLPRSSMLALYGGLLDRLVSLLASRITGEFMLSASESHAASRLEALMAIGRCDSEALKLKAAAMRTTQMARRSDINLELRRIQADRAGAAAILSSGG